MMAGKNTGSFWKSNGALESLTFHEVTSKGASPVKQPVLHLDTGLSFGGKVVLTDLNSDCGTSALWKCFSAGVLSLSLPVTGRGKHLPFATLDCLSHGYAESLGWVMDGLFSKVLD